jgi:hypothetical protein
MATTSQPRSLLSIAQIEHGQIASAALDLKLCPD